MGQCCCCCSQSEREQVFEEEMTETTEHIEIVLEEDVSLDTMRLSRASSSSSG